jgi:hypothetical protein
MLDRHRVLRSDITPESSTMLLTACARLIYPRLDILGWNRYPVYGLSTLLEVDKWPQ